jgi:phage terminase large subunit
MSTYHLNTTDVFRWNAGSQRFYTINQGGSSSSKTYSIMQLLVLRARERPGWQTGDPGWLTTVTAESEPALKGGAYKDLLDISETYPLDNFIKRMTVSPMRAYLWNGSVIEFKSYPTEKSAHHGKSDDTFFNEANGIPWPVADQRIMRTRRRVFIDFNPTADFWAHSEFLGDANAQWIFSTYRDNEFASPNMVAKIERYRETSWEHYKVYGLGKRGSLMGQVFPNVIWVPEYPKYVSDEVYFLDPGFTNGITALGKLGKADGKLWAKELLYEGGLSHSDTVRRCNDLKLNKRTRFVVDPANPALIKELRDADYNVVAIKKPGIADSISAVKSWTLCITADSLNAKKEQRNYIYKKDKKSGSILNVPIDSDNDFFDGLRYGQIELCYGGALPDFL